MPWILLYADDAMLASTDKTELKQKVYIWSRRLARFGLRLNVRKTEYLTTDQEASGSIQIERTELLRTKAFRYLGIKIAADGNINHEVTARINAAWMKWHRATGLLCEKKIHNRLNFADLLCFYSAYCAICH